MIRAAEQLVRLHPRARFLLVGDGLLRDALVRQIAAAGLTDRFQFAGLVPPEQIPQFIAAMDIVVHASLREGLARALPQALIAGKPVVSFDIDGAREVVLDDQTGFLVPPEDVGGLVTVLDRLLGDPGLRARLGAEGQRRFAAVFRHEHMTAQVRALYCAVAGQVVPPVTADVVGCAEPGTPGEPGASAPGYLCVRPRGHRSVGLSGG